jgi:DNA-binding MarR family transcriptional regulator
MAVKQKSNLNELVPLLFTVIRLIQARLTHVAGSSDKISSPLQWHTLHFIEEKKTPLMKEVADYLSITPSSVTPLIDGLVESKMLKRNFDKDDRRTIRLAITVKGEKAMKKEFNRMLSQMKKVLACLNEKEQRQLILIYKKVLNSLTN